MRTPTALLRIGAALGIQNAQKTLDSRRASNAPVLITISNTNTEWKEACCHLRDFRNADSLPPKLVSVRATPLPITADHRPDAGKAQAALQRNVLPDNRSWLHPGSGDGTARPATFQKPTYADVGANLRFGDKRIAPDVPRLPVLARELHPNALMNQHDFLNPRQDGLAIDLYGENGAAEYGLAGFNIAYAAINGGLFEREEELPIATASVEAAVRLREGDREIEAFDAMLNSYSEEDAMPDSDTPAPPPPPMPAPEASSDAVSPLPPSSAVRNAKALLIASTNEDLMADLHQAFARRQARQASMESAATGSGASSPTERPAVSTLASPLAAGLVKGFELMTDTHKESLSGYSSDSGRGSNLLDAGAESDHGWSDSEA